VMVASGDETHLAARVVELVGGGEVPAPIELET
jgi:hypothetical protein